MRGRLGVSTPLRASFLTSFSTNFSTSFVVEQVFLVKPLRGSFSLTR